MIRDYDIVSPSLEGVLQHGLFEYAGLRRPAELLRVLDGPAAKGRKAAEALPAPLSPHDRKVLEEYFHDLYGVFMKKLSYFVVESETGPDEAVKLQAMLQEMIKVKGLNSIDKKV